MVQQVLDLDLDFFLDKVCLHGKPRVRLANSEYHPWPVEDLRRFLEEKCGLSRECRIPGRQIKHHHEAVAFWRKRLNEGLNAPFDVVHVDAHADLGMQMSTHYIFLHCDFLALPVEERPKRALQTRLMNEGNYLQFAIAYRWLNALTYVPHDLSRPQDEVPYYMFKDWKEETNLLQLTRTSRKLMEQSIRSCRRQWDAVEQEPEIPYRVERWSAWKQSRPFDEMIVAQSPRYTPRTADSHLSVIGEYFDPV